MIASQKHLNILDRRHCFWVAGFDECSNVVKLGSHKTVSLGCVEHSGLTVLLNIRESNAGARSCKLSRPRCGAQTDVSDDELRVAGDSR